MQRLILILLVKMFILALLITDGQIGLAPDEAQYWTWSQALDWGYYSKPPGIAWQIWFTTAIFGNTVLGVRLGALIIGFVFSLVVYLGARWARLDKRTAFWAGIVAAFSPLGMYLSFAATTDGGAILFLMLAVACLFKERPNYWLIGLCVGAGALFKWTAFIFWPVLLIELFFFKKLRRFSILAGILISLLALLPAIYWNISHDWATFRHVGTAAVDATRSNFFDFLAAQVGLLSPVFFVLLILSYFSLKKEHQNLRIAGGFPLLIVVYLAAALFKKIQPNWAAYLYPPGFLLIAWYGLRKAKIWLPIGTWMSIAAIAVVFATARLPIPYKWNPLRQSLGWQNLSAALFESGYDPQRNFLFADKYQTTSLLSFYGPEQHRAYFFNISESRKNQFSYWPQMDEERKGQTGFFVVIENTTPSSFNWYEQHYQERLSPYFQIVHYQGAYPLYSVSGTPVKYAMIFKCIHYTGSAPETLEKY